MNKIFKKTFLSGLDSSVWLWTRGDGVEPVFVSTGIAEPVLMSTGKVEPVFISKRGVELVFISVLTDLVGLGTGLPGDFGSLRILIQFQH